MTRTLLVTQALQIAIPLTAFVALLWMLWRMVRAERRNAGRRAHGDGASTMLGVNGGGRDARCDPDAGADCGGDGGGGGD